MWKMTCKGGVFSSSVSFLIVPVLSFWLQNLTNFPIYPVPTLRRPIQRAPGKLLILYRVGQNKPHHEDRYERSRQNDGQNRQISYNISCYIYQHFCWKLHKYVVQVKRYWHFVHVYWCDAMTSSKRCHNFRRGWAKIASSSSQGEQCILLSARARWWSGTRHSSKMTAMYVDTAIDGAPSHTAKNTLAYLWHTFIELPDMWPRIAQT